MLHKLYGNPWKLFKDVEDIINDRRNGPKSTSSFNQSVPSDALAQHAAIGRPIHQQTLEILIDIVDAIDVIVVL
jgi:hypothetical protein